MVPPTTPTTTRRAAATTTMKRQRSSTERSGRRSPLLVPTLLALSTAAGVIMMVGNKPDDRRSDSPRPLRANDARHHWTRRRGTTSHRAFGVQTAGDGGAVGGRSLAAPGKEQADEDAAKHATSYAQRHPNYYNTNRYNSAASAAAAGGSSRSAGMEQHKYYNYEDDDKMEDFRRRYHHGGGGGNSFNYTDLTDVGLCLLTALGWAVWMISSAVSSKQAARAAAAGFLLAPDEGGMDERFWQRRPRDPVTGDDIALLHIHGNVLQVSKIVEQDSATEDGAGLVPLYRVVIDYNVVKSDPPPTVSPSTARTATPPPPPLETLQIRKQFDTRIELEPGFANVELLVLPEEPTLSILKDEYEEQMRLAKTRTKHGGNDDYNDDDDENDDEIILLDGSQCKRLSTVLAAFLVFASLAGTIQVVMLMEPDRRWQGWLCLCSGVALLLPCAVVLHKLIKLCAAYQEPSAKQGIVIGHGVLSPGHGDTMMLLYEVCLDAPPACCCEDGRQLNQVASYMAPETSGCYFIRYPTTSKRAAAATTTTATTAADAVSAGPTAAVAMADGTESSLVSSSSHEHILSSSNSSISSLSSDSPMHGQDMWQPVSGSMDSL